MTVNLPSELEQALTARYRDFADPWHGWVMPAYEAAPYKAIVEDIALLGAEVSDNTDLNYDVACSYFVRRGGVLVVAELSLVGPYAVVLDVEAVGPEGQATSLAQDVLGVLRAHGLHVMSPDVLRTPVNMPFVNVGPGQGTLYQALIADTPSPVSGFVA